MDGVELLGLAFPISHSLPGQTGGPGPERNLVQMFSSGGLLRETAVVFSGRVAQIGQQMEGGPCFLCSIPWTGGYEGTALQHRPPQQNRHQTEEQASRLLLYCMAGASG